jgi:hypothetical protein
MEVKKKKKKTDIVMLEDKSPTEVFHDEWICWSLGHKNARLI